MPFNLGGRINLLYCFFWGIAAVAWVKGVYLKIEKIVVYRWEQVMDERFGDERMKKIYPNAIRQ